MNDNEIAQVLNDPFTEKLLGIATLARLAYTGLDGGPRVIPTAFIRTGNTFQMFTITTSAKVKALQQDPRVALTIDTEEQPPLCLLVRGTAQIDIVDGVPDGYLAATGKRVSAEDMPGFEAQVRQMYQQMAAITITPTWAKILDFQTRAPSEVMRLAQHAQSGIPATPQE